MPIFATSLLLYVSLQISSEAVSKGSSSDPCVWMDRLAAIFRSSVMELTSGQVHPCAAIVEETWPFISASCYKFKQNQRIVERTCR